MSDFPYYVVEFTQSPNDSVPRFVCIPCSWIRAKPTLDKTTAIVFPDEQFVATEGRIMSGEPCDVNWNVHIVNIKFGCGNLNEGRKYAIDQCRAYNMQRDVKPNQNTPNKATTSSSAVDSPNRERKRSNIHIPDFIKSPRKTNHNQDKKRERIDREKRLLKRLSHVFQEMNEGFDNMCETLLNMKKVVGNIKTSLTETTELTNDFINKEKRMLHSHSPKKTPTRNLPFRFPDNLDTNAKWTIRFREPGEGRTELLPGSKVYVRKSEMETLEKEAANPRAAARMLMMEIFSDYALSVCSLAGGKGSGGRTNENERYPPGLDEYSRKVLMMYLKEFAGRRGWHVDENQVWMSLRNRLLELRKNKL